MADENATRPVTQRELEAMMGELRRQRDSALDRCLHMAAINATLSDEIQDAKAQIGELLDQQAAIRAEVIAAQGVQAAKASAGSGVTIEHPPIEGT